MRTLHTAIRCNVSAFEKRVIDVTLVTLAISKEPLALVALERHCCFLAGEHFMHNALVQM